MKFKNTALLVGIILISVNLSRAHAEEAKEILIAADQLRVKWVDVSTKVAVSHDVFVEAKICAAEDGSKNPECVSLGKFRPITIADGKRADVNKTSPVNSGESLNKKSAELTQKLSHPVVRLQLVLNERRSDGSIEELAHKYVDLPALSAKPKAGSDAFEMKVILEGKEVSAKTVILIKR